MVVTIWTGEYPNLCSGEWRLTIDGKDYSDKIPEELRTDCMDTEGTYNRWYFHNWSEEWETYSDGLNFSEWEKQNAYWINTLPADNEEIFKAFQLNDWRHGECGGCI